MRAHGSIVVAAVAVLIGEARAEAPGREEFRLPNGLRVRLVPAKGDKEAVVLLGVRGGFFAEPGGKPHLAHVAEHLVVFGARPGSDEAKAMGRWIDEGRANGETVGPAMYFDLRVTPEDLPAALRAQAGRLKGPTFTREVLDREVPQALGEVENLDGSDEGFTGKFATTAFVQAALHGRTSVPLKATTRGFTPEDVRDFWARSARPDRAILCVVGGFDPGAVQKEIEAAFGTIPAPAAPSPGPPPPLKPGRIAATWDLRARHLLLAWPAPEASEADHAALSVAAPLLMQRLLNDPEIDALAKAPLVSNDTDRVFLIDVYVKPGADVDALEARVLDRVGKLSGQGAPTDREVAEARAAAGQMLGPIDVDAIDLPPDVTRLMARGNVELQRLIDELSWGDLAPYKARLDAVDRRKVIDAAASHLDPARATIVRLGPAR